MAGSGRVTASACTVLLLLGLLTAGLLGNQRPTTATSPVTVSPAAYETVVGCWSGMPDEYCRMVYGVRDQCQDVLVVGARGSGESWDSKRGFGKAVWPGVKEYVEEVSPRRVGLHALRYPALGVDRLFRDLVRDTNDYFDGLNRGVRNAVEFLQARAVVCPRERVVLAGYSQGGMVMHRVMNKFARSQAMAGRVDGVLVIGDGDRFPLEGGASYGSQPNDRSGKARDMGVTWIGKADGSRRGAVPGDVPWPRKFHSVCNRLDAVCDTHNLLRDHGLADGAVFRLYRLTKILERGVAAHETYVSDPRPTRKAARAIAAVSRKYVKNPPMQVNVPDLTAPVGAPYSYRMTAAGGVAPYRFRALAALPAGLTLNSDGLLHGSVSQPSPAGGYWLSVRAEDVNGQRVDVGVRLDTYQAGTFTRLTPAGTPVGSAEVSFDGQTVVFESPSPSLVSEPGGSNSPDVFLWSGGAVSRVSAGGTTRMARFPDVSSDGTVVTFLDYPYDQDMEMEAGPPDLVRVDRTTGQRQVLLAAADVRAPRLSGNGRFVTFSSADPLLAGDSNGQTDVFVIDAVSGELWQVTDGDAESFGSDISADGDVVVFATRATNLNYYDDGPGRDVFRTVRSTGVTEQLSIQVGDSVGPRVSADGTTVVFDSASGPRLWRQDGAGGGMSGTNEPGAGAVSVSADGSTVVWHAATDESASQFTVRAYDVTAGSMLGWPWTGGSDIPAVSGNGQRIVFRSNGLVAYTR